MKATRVGWIARRAAGALGLSGILACQSGGNSESATSDSAAGELSRTVGAAATDAGLSVPHPPTSQDSAARAQRRTWTFDDMPVGATPAGFSFGHTRKVGAAGKWSVREEGGSRFLSQIDPDRTNARFPIAVVDDLTAKDVDLSVRFRPVSGRVDQAAGLVWRYRDEDNYYIVRANAREENVVMYKVENGKRTDLPLKGEGRTYGKSATVPRGQWSTLRAVAEGTRFEIWLNGTRLYEVEDSTFTEAGKVGVWTKADSVTDFDDLAVLVK